MAHYGIPYKGNKSKIAEEILEALPSGRRLVDLFGGGFAITECALRKFPNKWERFFWNDYDKRLAPLIEDAIAGKYSPERFKPKWITRDEFNAKRDEDGYIAFVWSFGNNGRDYLFGADVEEVKRQAFEFVVNGTPSGLFPFELVTKSVHDRRIEFMRKTRTKDEGRLIPCERLENLENLESIGNLQCLTQLEPLSRLDYRDYEYQEGDVIYCDIPYENELNPTYHGIHEGGFDHEAFYKWASEQPATVYYSNYTRGALIWQKQVRSVLNSSSGAVYRNEALLAIGSQEKPKASAIQDKQISLFDF